MRVLFAGGTGFVGKTFLSHLHELQGSKEFELTILSRDPCSFSKKNPELFRKSEHYFNVVQQSLPNISIPGTFDVIIHGAESPSTLVSAEQVSQSHEALEAILAFSKLAAAKRIIYLSSGAVYKLAKNTKPPYEPTRVISNSSSILQPYAHSKYISERRLEGFSDATGIEHVILRVFNVASQYVPLNGSYALGNFVRDALDTGVPAIRINGSGRDKRSFISGRDISRVLAYCFEDAPAGSIFNACSGVSMSILDMAKLVQGLAPPIKPIIVESPDTPANHYTGVSNLPASFNSSRDDIRSEISGLLAHAKIGTHD